MEVDVSYKYRCCKMVPQLRNGHCWNVSGAAGKMETNFSTPLNEYEEGSYESAGYTVLRILPLVVLGVTFVLGVLGNGLVIWVAGFRMTRTVTTICYLNLALADFSFTATLPFLIVSMAMGEKWPFGWFLCKLIHTWWTSTSLEVSS